MNVTLSDPEVARFIEGEVDAGRYESAEAMLTGLVRRAIVQADRPAEDHEVDDVTVARLNEAYERARRGAPGYSREEAKRILLDGGLNPSGR